MATATTKSVCPVGRLPTRVPLVFPDPRRAVLTCGDHYIAVAASIRPTATETLCPMENSPTGVPWASQMRAVPS